jgi:hypothetical protein
MSSSCCGRRTRHSSSSSSSSSDKHTNSAKESFPKEKIIPRDCKGKEFPKGLQRKLFSQRI